MKFAFNPDQPRDENGRFASGGGGGAAEKDPGKHVDAILNVLHDGMSNEEFERGMTIVTELQNKGPRASQALKDKAKAFVDKHKNLVLRKVMRHQ